MNALKIVASGVVAFAFSMPVAKADIKSNSHVWGSFVMGADIGRRGNLVETGATAETFQIFFAAVEAADLTDLLAKQGPYTVFAPTDEAFAKLPTGAIERLLKAENKHHLVALISRHIVPGTWISNQLDDWKTALTTISGAEIWTNGVDGLSYGGGKVIRTDITATNGIIHAIDSVLTAEVEWAS
jgi:uncharacterized surface protein with fasciclin (FAS1) repeats